MKKHTEVLAIENKSQDACYADNMRKVYARLYIEQRIWLDEENLSHRYLQQIIIFYLFKKLYSS